MPTKNEPLDRRFLRTFALELLDGVLIVVFAVGMLCLPL